jgi:hypothetical protein
MWLLASRFPRVRSFNNKQPTGLILPGCLIYKFVAQSFCAVRPPFLVDLY